VKGPKATKDTLARRLKLLSQLLRCATSFFASLSPPRLGPEPNDHLRAAEAAYSYHLPPPKLKNSVSRTHPAALYDSLQVAEANVDYLAALDSLEFMNSRPRRVPSRVRALSLSSSSFSGRPAPLTTSQLTITNFGDPIESARGGLRIRRRKRQRASETERERGREKRKLARARMLRTRVRLRV